MTTAGLQSPFLDVEAALKAVETDPKLLMKAKKFRLRMESDSLFRELIMGPQKAAKKQPAPAPVAVVTVTNGASKANGANGAGEKKYRPQLIRRLTDVLWKENEETREAARQRAWKILKAGGFRGETLSWRDEAKAIAIFTKAGVDMSKFEYVTTAAPGSALVVTSAAPLIPAPLPTTPVPVFDGGILEMILPLCEPKHREQVTEILRSAMVAVQRMHGTVEKMSDTLTELKAGAEVARRVKTTLEQFEHAWFSRMGKREVPYGINMVFDALAEFRAPPVVKG